MDHEQQPLLNAKPFTPLPRAQLTVACLAVFVEIVAFTQIFPYINQMVEELHLAKRVEDVGFYSGLIDGLFSVMMVLTIYQWGSLSDRIGRRPIIITGLLGLIPSSLFFGLSTKLWQLIVSRGIAGALCGNGPVIQSFVGEITDETNQAKAFPLLMVSYYFGLIAGPVIGGTLSHPAERLPRIFGTIQVLREHPYFLPCLVSAILTAATLLCAAALLRESLQKDHRGLSPSDVSHEHSDAYASLAQTLRASGIDPSRKTKRWILQDARVKRYLCARFLLSFNSLCFDTVLLLFCYTPIRLGGLERNPADIGTALAVSGVLGILACLLVFPALQRKFGTLRVYATAISFWPVAFLCFPVVGWVVHWTEMAGFSEGSSTLRVVIWVGISALLLLARAGNIAYTADALVVKSLSSDSHMLGRLFGLATAAGMAGQAIGPYFVSCLFALSIDRQAGHLVWGIMTLIALAGAFTAHSLKPRS